MKYRYIALCCAVVALTSVTIAAQAPRAAGGTAAPTTSYTPPRTAWGDPDLQGIWRTASGFGVPLERPQQYPVEKQFFTDAEMAAKLAAAEKRIALTLAGKLESRGFRNNPNNNVIFEYTGEPPRINRRTSSIIDPPDGRLPAWTLEQVKRWEEREAATREHGDADVAADRGYGERCLQVLQQPALSNWGLEFGGGFSTFGGRQYGRAAGDAGIADVASMGDGLDSSTYGARDLKILQTPGYVAIVSPAYEEYRIIPLNQHAGLPKFRTYNGNTFGHWEGNTLIVEITNIKYEYPIIPGYFSGGNYPGTGETLKITERYTPLDANNLEYRYTIEDPGVYTRPYTVQVDMFREDAYPDLPELCHENNLRDFGGILTTARADEYQAIENMREVQRERDKWLQMRKQQALEAASKSRQRRRVTDFRKFGRFRELFWSVFSINNLRSRS